MKKGVERVPLKERFFAFVEKTEQCWLWKGTKDKDGYGKIWIIGHGNLRAHRISYALHFKDPGALFVLHKCDNPSCIRPEHLFLGTNSDNQRDAVRKKRQRHSRQTHCINGHPFSKQNTWIWRNQRKCRECGRKNCKKYQFQTRLTSLWLKELD